MYNKKELKNILYNYKNKLKRIDEIRRDTFNICALNYSNNITSSNRNASPIENSIIQLYENLEFKELSRQTQAVQKILLTSDPLDLEILEYYFFKKKGVYYMWRSRKISNGTLYKRINTIVDKLDKLLNKDLESSIDTVL